MDEMAENFISLIEKHFLNTASVPELILGTVLVIMYDITKNEVCLSGEYQ